MVGNGRKTGIDIVGNVPWGTHLCQFYDTKVDLIEILVPYFKAGLENNEFCMWITSEPLQAEEAKAALSKEVPNLDDYIKKEQIEILEYSQWYKKSGEFNFDEVFQGWVEREHAAIEKGFDGLRLSGNTFWLERKDWGDFYKYEAVVDSAMANHHVLAICSYSLDRCSTSDLVDVVSVHESAIIKKEGRWQLKESARRKQIEGKLAASTKKFRLIAEIFPDYVFQTDSHGTLVYASPFVKRMLGYDPEELEGINYIDLVTTSSLSKALSILERASKGEVLQSIEVELFHKGGKVIPVEISLAPIIERNKMTGYLAIARDITERKKAEAERKELERKAQVNARMASIGEMAAGIAHEINNPLTSVLGFSEILMEKDLPEDLREEVGIICDGSQRVSDIVKGLLTFARQHKPVRNRTDINEIIESTLALRKYSLETGNIEVNTLLDAGLPWIVVDRGQLQQVFMNIIVNAETEMRKAHGRGRLTIKTERIDNKIRLSFADDGPGIAMENIGKLFDPLFTTKEVGEGTGLGLSLSYGIIVGHKGAMYAESEAGEGATFIIELPIVAEEEEKIERVEAVEEDGKATGGRILVVDDEPTILTFLKKVLSGEGYDVETVSSGREALKMIKNQRYSLILCDIKLPGLSGIELYEQIEKEIAPSLQKRVIFITGDVISADTQAFLKRAKALYLNKPFDIAGLRKEVKRVIISNS